MENLDAYSKIIAGTMTWGSWGKQFSDTQMVEMIHHCIDLGITTFDHADIYGDYSTEEAFGLAFSKSEIAREQIQLISKCGIQMTSRKENRLKHYSYAKEYIIWSVDQSLQKLQTTYLDFLLLHRPSPLMNPDSIASAVEELQNQRKITHFGVSNFSASQIGFLEKRIKVIGNQVEFSLTHTDPMYNGTFDDCIQHNRMAMAWSPLGSYFKEPQKNTRLAKCVAELADKYDTVPAQLLVAWILRHPAKIYPVIGTTNKERLKALVAAQTIELELQDWFALLAAQQGHEVP